MNFLKSRLLWILHGRDGASAIFQTIASRVLVLSLNICTGVLTARALGPDGRGEQAAIILWATTLPYLATLGLPAAIIYFGKREPERQGETLGTAFFLGALFSLCAVGIGFLGLPHWLNNYSEQTVSYARWLLLSIPIGLLTLLIACAAETLGNFSLSNKTRLLPPVMSLLILLGLTLANRLSPFVAALAMILPSIPVFFIVATALSRAVRIEFNHPVQNSFKLLHYGIRAYGIDVVNTLAGRIDQIFIVGLLSGESLGIYVVSTSIAGMLNTIQNSVTTVLLPKITGKPRQEIELLSSLVFRTFLLLGGAGILLIGLLSPFLLSLLYGDSFLAATPTMRILLVEAWIASAAGILSQAFLAVGKPGFLTILQGASLGITVLFLSIGVPLYGLLGACLSLLAADSLKLLLIMLSFKFVLNMSIPSPFLNRSDLRILAYRLRKIPEPAT